MGLLFAESASGGAFAEKVESKWLGELGCKACPLNKTPGKIDATGAKKPLIYVLGEAAGKNEEEERKQFVGKSGQLLRSLMPREALQVSRFNNTLNCHPPGNRDPSKQELACCRPRVVTDIEESKPKAIWGFGNFPLNWISGFNGISHWRGRRMPIKVGTHTCWYYAFLHPSYLLHNARDNGRDFGSEEERMTFFDLERAYADLDGLEKPVVHTEAMAKANVELVFDVSKIEAALRWASHQPSVGVDYETNRKRPYFEGAKILSASIGTLERSYAFPIRHPGSGFTPKQVAQVEELWTRFLTHASCLKTVHNLAFEQEWSAFFYGKETVRARPWGCTAIAASIVDERTGGKVRNGPFSLAHLVQQYFGFDVKKISNVDRANLENTPVETVLAYNGIDSKYHDGLWYKLQEEIKLDKLEFAHGLAQRRVPTVVSSQLKGAPVSQPVVRALEKKYGTKVDDAETKIDRLSVVQRFQRLRGREFNPASGPDLLYVLHDMLKCREVEVQDKYTKKSKLSTEETVLNEIIKNHPDRDAAILAKAMIELREASGTKSKYVDSLLIGAKKCVVFPDGLIHTNFNTYFAETGRLSSDEPNLQNFPKRDAETKEVRKSVAAPPGCVVLSFDYGQIEARVIAMFTKDPVFVKALWERFDVHEDWAQRLAYAYPARVGGKKFLKDKKVMRDFRTDIKNQWTFPLFFGARDTSVAGYLNMPLDIIRREIREFWKVFAGAKSWQEKLLASYQELGYTECLTGRRRRGPLSVNQTFNSPVQGTAAEIVLDAMCRLSETGNPELQPEINIHDDLTYLRVPKNRVDIVAEQVIEAMIAVPFKWINVPIQVEMSMGKNWCEMEEIEKFSSDTWRA